MVALLTALAVNVFLAIVVHIHLNAQDIVLLAVLMVLKIPAPPAEQQNINAKPLAIPVRQDTQSQMVVDVLTALRLQELRREVYVQNVVQRLKTRMAPSV